MENLDKRFRGYLGVKFVTVYLFLIFPIKICLDYYLFKFVFPYFVLMDELFLRTIEVVNLLCL